MPPATVLQVDPVNLSIYKSGGEPEPTAVIVEEMLACRHPFAPVMVKGPWAMTSELADTVPL